MQLFFEEEYQPLIDNNIGLFIKNSLVVIFFIRLSYNGRRAFSKIAKKKFLAVHYSIINEIIKVKYFLKKTQYFKIIKQYAETLQSIGDEMRFYLLISVLFVFSLDVFSTTESYKYHTLKEGETLWRISKNYKVSLDRLCKLNNIKDVTKVRKGFVIKIPTGAVTSDKKKVREYFNFTSPLKGDVKPFVTPNFKGVIIFGNKPQEPVKSVSEGTVGFIDNLDGYGLSVIIKNKSNVLTIYSGFSVVYVKNGENIKKDQIIGKIGILPRYGKNGIFFAMKKDNKYLRYETSKAQFFYE